MVQHPAAGLRSVCVAPGLEPLPVPSRFRVHKRRWVVERPVAGLGCHRRLRNDDEALPASDEA